MLCCYVVFLNCCLYIEVIFISTTFPFINLISLNHKTVANIHKQHKFHLHPSQPWLTHTLISKSSVNGLLESSHSFAGKLRHELDHAPKKNRWRVSIGNSISLSTKSMISSNIAPSVPNTQHSLRSQACRELRMPITILWRDWRN